MYTNSFRSCVVRSKIQRAASFTTSNALQNVELNRSAWDTKSAKFQYLERSKLPSYHFQKSLPRLPIPNLSDTCRRYLNAQIPLLTQEEHEYVSKLVENFQNGVGKELDQRLRATDAINKHTNYVSEVWFDMYLTSRTPLPIDFNPALIFVSPPESQLVKSTNLVVSALRFMRSLKEEVLSPEVFHLNPAKSDTNLFRTVTRLLPPAVSWYGAYLFKAFPLDMSQYSSLFNSTRIPKKEKDILRRDNSGRHILVMKNGRFYKVDVLDTSGNIIPPADIKKGLEYIFTLNAGLSQNPIGILTTKGRDEWATLREHLQTLPGNAEALKDIDSAIFVLCLEDSAPRDNPEATVRMALHSDGINRWFDKSFSLIVAKDGTTGLNFEHSWGDGVAVLRFSQDVIKDSSKNKFVDSDTKSNVRPGDFVKELAFNVDEKLSSEITKATQEYKERCSKLALNVKQQSGFGKKHCKAAKISPDSVMQLAMQVAYHKVYNGFVGTYESCSTAAYKHGRTETVRPNTVATRDFALAFNKSTQLPRDELIKMMQNCSKLHNELTKEAAMGQGFDRHLFALKNLAAREGVAVDLFTHPSYQKINHNIISTSTLPAVEIEGGAFGPVVPDGFGAGYAIFENKWGLVCTSYPDKRDGSSFADAFQETIEKFSSLIGGK